MAKQNHTHTSISNRNLKDSKWLILLLLKEGRNRKEIEDTLKLTKSTVLGHIRDMKKKELVSYKSVFIYHLTPKGYEITYEEFKNMFNRAGGRFPPEIQVDKRKRFHNLFFTSQILEFPSIIPSNAEQKEFSKNNTYYAIKYKNGIVKYHTKKAILQVGDFTASDVDDGSLETIKRLNLLIEEIQNDGFKLDKVYKTSQYHIAHMWHPLAMLFKVSGSCIIVEDRLIIDFSHKVPELETINKNIAEEDMKKMEVIHKAFLDSPLNNAEIFAAIYRNIDVKPKKKNVKKNKNMS